MIYIILSVLILFSVFDLTAVYCCCVAAGQSDEYLYSISYNKKGISVK